MATPLETIAKLQKRKDLFLKQLNQSGRLWFTTRIVKHVQSDPDFESLAEIRLSTAKEIASARLLKGRKDLVDDLRRPKQNEIRARIVYGILGNFPEIPLDLLDFVLKRRYRSMQRMFSYINPNRTRNILDYPPSVLTAQVNKHSKEFWEGIDADKKYYPFQLTDNGRAAPKDAIERLFLPNDKKADRTLLDCPAAAMLTHLDALLQAKNPDKLAKTLANDRPASLPYVMIDHPYGATYLLDTGYVGGFGGYLSKPAAKGPSANDPNQGVELKMFTGMSAFEATEPDKYLNLYLMDGHGREQIKVMKITPDKITNELTGRDLKNHDVCIQANPLNQVTIKVERLDRDFSEGAHIVPHWIGWFHVVADDRLDKALFDRRFIPSDDLQVGDHIYLANHPIHVSRIGSTPWNGEHAFVVQPWVSNPKQIRIIGHGINEQTVLSLTQKMLDEINVFLDITRSIVDKWLAIPSHRPPDQSYAGPATPFLKRLLARFLLESSVPFDGTARVFNQSELPYRKGGKKRTYPDYWVMELEGESRTGSGTVSIARNEVLLFDYDPRTKVAKPYSESRPWTNPVAVMKSKALVAMTSKPKHQFSVTYSDNLVGMELDMPLYHPLPPHKGNPVRLTFDNIKRSVFFGLADGRIFVVRPRVNTDDSYLFYLSDIGAT